MSDLISRQAAIIIPVLPKEHREYQTQNIDDAFDYGWDEALKCVSMLPSAQPEPERKTGKWIWCGDKHVCSECDEFALCDAYDVLDTGEYQEKLTDFCPYCGADMRGEQNER